MINAEEIAMEVWCEADLAVAGGNVTAHRKRIAKAIRAAQRSAIMQCIRVVVEQTTINMAEVDLLERIEIEIRALFEQMKET